MISLQLRTNTTRQSVCHFLTGWCSFVCLLNYDIEAVTMETANDEDKRVGMQLSVVYRKLLDWRTLKWKCFWNSPLSPTQPLHAPVQLLLNTIFLRENHVYVGYTPAMTQLLSFPHFWPPIICQALNKHKQLIHTKCNITMPGTGIRDRGLFQKLFTITFSCVS